MSSLKDKRNFHLIDEYEPPEKKILSDGDILIKELVAKQKNTQITLKSELSKANQFLHAAPLVSITNYHSGESNLKQFEKISQQIDDIEKLNAIGLSNEEITLVLDYKNDEEILFKKHPNMNKTVLQNRLKEILKKIANGNKEITKTEEKYLGRQKTEFALSVKPNSLETKLLKFAINNKETEAQLPHPLNNIKQIESQLFPKVTRELIDVKKIRRKARKLAGKLNTNYSTNIVSSTQSQSLVKNNISKWDVKEATPDVLNKKENKLHTCLPQTYYTIRDGQIVKLNKGSTDYTTSSTNRQQLTLDEIKQIPKFKNYKIGVPSKILYIKNLPDNIDESKLKTYFEEFDGKKLDYKIMTGKMHGQAFVYFPDEASADAALKNLNGLVINNKPIIVQFGKGKLNS